MALLPHRGKRAPKEVSELRKKSRAENNLALKLKPNSGLLWIQLQQWSDTTPKEGSPGSAGQTL